MISINIQSLSSVSLVLVEGKLDTTTCLEFDKSVQPLVQNENFIIIDLSECTYLSSAGIRVLIISEKKLLAKGGGLFLSGLLPEVYQVIEMAGLQVVFRIFRNNEEALAEIRRKNLKADESIKWQNGEFSFNFIRADIETNAATLWHDQGLAGLDELKVAIGTDSQGFFVTCCRCAGFIPDDTGVPPDFKLPKDPAKVGIFVKQAVSFGCHPTGLARLSEPCSITLEELANGIFSLKTKISPDSIDLIAMIVANFNPMDQSVIIYQFNSGEDGVSLTGAKFVLADICGVPTDASLAKFLDSTLTLENIIAVEKINCNDVAVNPMAWVFISDTITDVTETRLKIDTSGEVRLEPHIEFLVRRLYTDSARVIIKQIHGGYSAKTYQVTSYDSDNRKLRPTVLKIANKAIITRESERCQKYALPYILNNSAIVLGNEFFGDTGALRYNFVGIGGEQTQLQWLTHYYNSWPVDKLEPLLDKIFLQILNPWYGQPVNQTIFPYRDHDPTFTFFPNLCKTAEETFSITADDEFFTIRETGRKLRNPYWFLKHEFENRRETAMDYYTSICHGDLNMQNILLDQDMNVYLIDFSETRPRSLVSDFARLEAIFIVDNAPVENDSDMEEYVKFISGFYNINRLDEIPVNCYKGKHSQNVDKAYSLSLKMRKYAYNSVDCNPNPLPYYLALLEWVLPVVCYSSASLAQKRISMIVAGLLCEKC
ncbi:MAG: STAS domain-containing protein [Bacteroidales bacterium]|jgi:anti-anti-sigma factor